MTVTPAELARSLIERKRAEREAYVRRAAAIEASLTGWARASIAAGLLRRAWLVGSLARDAFGPASDVDVVVEGLSPERQASVWVELVRLLDSEVDLLRLEELPPSFAERVLREGAALV